ncbi:AQP4 protein, partial [Amia calva]|nr:AQP4 protein [Amia calva]
MSFRALCGGQVMAACGGVWDRRFLAALGGEFVAVFLFMLISLGSTVSLDDGAVPSTHIALCFGFTVAVLVHSFGHICEACLNPAVVLAMVLTRKITIAKGFLYIVVQCLASFTGTAFVFLATRAEYRKAFGVTKVNTSITIGQALLIESTTTLLLVFALFASCDRNRTDARLPASLIIGLAVAAGHLFAVRIHFQIPL